MEVVSDSEEEEEEKSQRAERDAHRLRLETVQGDAYRQLLDFVRLGLRKEKYFMVSHHDGEVNSGKARDLLDFSLINS